MTKVIDPRAYAYDCGCGALRGQACPHTPIRCKHRWLYSQSTATPAVEYRECEWCGYRQRGEFKMIWEREEIEQEKP